MEKPLKASTFSPVSSELPQPTKRCKNHNMLYTFVLQKQNLCNSIWLIVPSFKDINFTCKLIWSVNLYGFIVLIFTSCSVYYYKCIVYYPSQTAPEGGHRIIFWLKCNELFVRIKPTFQNTFLFCFIFALAARQAEACGRHGRCKFGHPTLVTARDRNLRDSLSSQTYIILVTWLGLNLRGLFNDLWLGTHPLLPFSGGKGACFQ